MKKPNILKWIGIILIIGGFVSVVGQNMLFNVLRSSDLLTNSNASYITILYSLIALMSIVSGVLLINGNILGEKIYLLGMPIAIGVEIIMVGFTPMIISNAMSCILIYFLLNSSDVKSFFREKDLQKKETEMNDLYITKSPYKLIGIFIYGISLFVLTGAIILWFLAITDLGTFGVVEIILLILGIFLNVFSLKLWNINKKFICGVSIIVIGSLFLINAVTFSLLERAVSEQIVLLKYIVVALIGIGQLFLGKSLVLKSRK